MVRAEAVLCAPDGSSAGESWLQPLPHQQDTETLRKPLQLWPLSHPPRRPSVRLFSLPCNPSSTDPQERTCLRPCPSPWPNSGPGSCCPRALATGLSLQVEGDMMAEEGGTEQIRVKMIRQPPSSGHLYPPLHSDIILDSSLTSTAPCLQSHSVPGPQLSAPS